MGFQTLPFSVPHFILDDSVSALSSHTLLTETPEIVQQSKIQGEETNTNLGWKYNVVFVWLVCLFVTGETSLMMQWSLWWNEVKDSNKKSFN